MTIPNNLYDHLEQSGVLVNGSSEKIQEAKKEYWKLRRKEWRKKQRLNCKSCTVFFKPSEHQTILHAIPGKRKNVAGFVKQAALDTAANKQALTREMVGKIREALYTSYTTIENIGASTEVKNVLGEMEQKILHLIQ